MNDSRFALSVSAARVALSPSLDDASIAPVPIWQLRSNRAAALTELERRVYRVLSNYSNVHRGSGHHSRVTTALYEHARAVVLEYLALDPAKHVVIFSNPYGAEQLASAMDPKYVRQVSSHQFGLPLGIRALAVPRHALPRGEPVRTGGGTARLVSPNSAIWEDAPERFEAGTPAIVNVIAFACALRILRRCGSDVFLETSGPFGELAPPEAGIASLDGAALMAALRRSMIGRDLDVPSEDGVQPYVHFDSAASTLTLTPVWHRVRQIWRMPETARSCIGSDVRRICAEFVGASRENYAVVFTANTTEAINAVATSLGGTVQDEGIRPVVLNTWLEHNSNELPWRRKSNASLIRLSVDDDGFIDLDELEHVLRAYNVEGKHKRRRIVLVAVSGASNVLGSYNDLAAICRIAHQYGASVLVDAAQLAPHRKIDMDECGIDYLTLSGHKLYAPFGSGALIARRELLRPMKEFWEMVNASGEENLVGVAALGEALSLLQRIGMDVVEAEERRLTERLLQGLSKIPGVKVWGAKDPSSTRRGGIVTFSVKHVPHNCLAQELADRGGIGIRTGCHCAHLLVKRMFRVHPLQAKVPDLIMLLFPRFLLTALPGLARLSIGIGNDERDVDHFLTTLTAICAAPRSWRERMIASDHRGKPFLPISRVGRLVENAIETTLKEVYG